jgi:hypothetical protein
LDVELARLVGEPDNEPPQPQVDTAYRHMPAVDRPARHVGVDSPLDTRVWGAYGAARERSLVRTRLRREAREVGQVLGLDLVRELLDQVAQDPRLLAPVREAMVALEPALARLAMHSPRFFGEQDNPARRLLESVAQRSFRYNDEFAPEFQGFHARLCSRFNALNAIERIEDPAPFEQALEALATQWMAEDRAEERRRTLVVEAAKAAERRQHEADAIAAELAQRSDLEGTPAVVQEFLFGPWTLVIAHARLRNPGGTVDPGGYIAVVADLIWTVKPELALRDPARAFLMIPQVLTRLRAGLETLRLPPTETEAFFHALEQLHRPVIELRAKRRRKPGAGAGASVDDEALLPAAAQKPRARDELWLGDEDMRAVGFEDTVVAERLVEGAPPAEPADDPPADDDPPSRSSDEAIVDALLEGCWVDLFSKQKWHRAQLTWASGNRTLYMFVSHGGRPHSMSRRSLLRLLAANHLRPVDTQEVVARAIEVLAEPQLQPLAA